MLFVDLNDHFSCQEFDSLTVYGANVPLKAVEKTQ